MRKTGLGSPTSDLLYPVLPCDWFDKHLTDFLRRQDNSLEISGRPGSGKTSLFHWTIDILRRRVLGKVYITLAYSVDPATVVETTATRLLQSLLTKVINRNPGIVDKLQSLKVAYKRQRATPQIPKADYGKLLRP